MIFKNKTFKIVATAVIVLSIALVVVGIIIQNSKPREAVNSSSALATYENGDLEYVYDTTTKENVLENTISSFNPQMSLYGTFRALLGLIVVLFISWLLSINRKAIKWKFVFIALAFQIIIACSILYIPFVSTLFEYAGKIFVYINMSAKVGSEFLLGGLIDNTSIGYVFIFNIFPSIIIFSVLMSLLFYFRVIQFVVKCLGWLFSKVMGLTGIESTVLAANIFLGQVESPLIIKEYLNRATDSEMFIVMVGGMATMSGAVLSAYINLLGGENIVLSVFFAKHLIAASVMAAPAAIVVGRIMVPQIVNNNNYDIIVTNSNGKNIFDVIANGATDGLKLVVNVAVLLLAFVSLITLLNLILCKVGDWTQLNNWIASNTVFDKFSLQFLLGYSLAPIMWLIGAPNSDIMSLSQLLGIKTIMNEFVGYGYLKSMISSGILTVKGTIMAVYILCGFANFGSLAMLIGGLGTLSPCKKHVINKYGIRALIAAAITALVSAIIMSMLLD